MTTKQKFSKTEICIFAANIKAILRDQGRTQRWLARNLDMEYSQLRHILLGDSRYKMDDDFLCKVADILGITPWEIKNWGNGNERDPEQGS